MGTVADFLVRGIGVGVLLLVMVGAAQGIWWLARPTTGILVRPFDIIRGGEVHKGEAEIIARLLASKIRRIDHVLSTDLRNLRPPPGIRIDRVSPPALKLESHVASQLDIELRPFDFDVAGILNLASGWLHRGQVVRGGTIFGDREIEVYAELTGGDPESRLGPWTVRSAATLDDAVEELGHAIVLDYHRTHNPQLALLEGGEFRHFLSALEEYQTFVQSGGIEGGSTPGSHLERALSLLKPLADKPSRSVLVYSYLGSIYSIMGRPEEARATLQEGLKRNLESDPFVTETLAQLEGVLAARPTTIATRGGLDALLRQRALEIVHAQDAIEETRGASLVTVAILADGVSPSVEELRDRMLPGRSFVPRELDTVDPTGHGTAVASLIAAISPQARILPIKVIGQQGISTAATIPEAVAYAMERGARVLVLPFGTPAAYEELDRALGQAQSRSVFVVAPAGNEGSARPIYPAAFRPVIAVAATDGQDRRAPFSSFGHWVSLAAPGVDVVTIGLEGKLERISGSSFACAIAAGVAALVISVRPDLSAMEVREILGKTAVDLSRKEPDLQGQLGAGRVDALAAVRAAKAFERTVGQEKSTSSESRPPQRVAARAS